MRPLTRAGVTDRAVTAGGFAPYTEPVAGNAPWWTGSPGNVPDAPGPHPGNQPLGGRVGRYDGASGSDPWRAPIQPHPRVDYHDPQVETIRRYGIKGFNDQLQVRDRHVYWDAGTSRTGANPGIPGNPPNPQADGPAQPTLRVVNRSVNPLIGSDASRNADDLARPYTWLGQQDGTTVPVYGGVPGLYQSYGNRGRSELIYDPSNGTGGLTQVTSGPPHGLHSDTIPDGKQLQDRYKANPQMRPVRQDRPSNSRSAGQSYSQTVVPQGGIQNARPPMQHRGGGTGLSIGGRGWIGG